MYHFYLYISNDLLKYVCLQALIEREKKRTCEFFCYLGMLLSRVNLTQKTYASPLILTFLFFLFSFSYS